ncbi:poly [Prunus yedoensis var. nudiflora]|uniref:Poly n=1 Tax=Prunus yedoensis var. nudiflora TaxID=2094558 RepID=A0A314Z767_PRUYE|nr:poly [Prunus yedoensis var. nudiflora]
MRVHETRSHSHPNTEEDKVMTRKQKAENKAHEAEQSPKKPKSEGDNGHANGKSSEDIVAEFEKVCTAVKDNLSTEQMREILEANGQDSSGSDANVLRKCQDLLFYGPLDKCPACNGNLEFTGIRYSCTGSYSEWASCTYTTKDPSRKQEPIKLPDSALNSPASRCNSNFHPHHLLFAFDMLCPHYTC